MPIAIDPAKTWEYVLKSERESSDPTRFILATLTVAEEANLQDRLVAVDGATKLTTVASGTHTLEVLRLGLRGWISFRFSDGREVPFETDAGRRFRGVCPPSDKTLGYLSPADRKELAEAIVERNATTEDERKNSASEPAS